MSLGRGGAGRKRGDEVRRPSIARLMMNMSNPAVALHGNSLSRSLSLEMVVRSLTGLQRSKIDAGRPGVGPKEA